MWLTASALFWSSVGVISYTYLGYPLSIYLLSRVRQRKVAQAQIEPTVSVVLSVYNEQAHIGTKLNNLLGLDYPEEKLQVIAVSDGSTDDTDAIIADRAARDSRVLHERLEHRGGKAQALNAGVQRARGEVVLFCDTRQRIEPEALRAMVPLFADPQVGAVSGELMLHGERGPGVYWAYEKIIRAAEGRVDSMVGATGALYAIRRHLYQRLPDDCLLDDVYTPMQVVLQGYRVVFQPEARCHDHEASLSGEFSRKARTLAGNFQLLTQLPQVINPLRNRVFFQFASHKLMRLVCPLALGTLLASNVVLVATGAPGWPLYVVTLAGQLAGYGLALKGAIQGPRAGKLARLSSTFVTLNTAAVAGLRRYLRRDYVWTTAGD